MTTLAEIQDAISQLSDGEQTALAAWLDSRRTSSLNIQDEESLLCSLDEATNDINAGKFNSAAPRYLRSVCARVEAVRPHRSP
jgi:hypothetical protein